MDAPGARRPRRHLRRQPAGDRRGARGDRRDGRREVCPSAAQRLGDQLKAVLEGLRAEVPQIADVRGLGAMVAVEFNDSRQRRARRRLHQARAGRGAAAQADPADLRRQRQRGALPVPADHAAAGVRRGAWASCAKPCWRHDERRCANAWPPPACTRCWCSSPTCTASAKGKLVPLAHLDDVLTDRRRASPARRSPARAWPRTGPRSEYMARAAASTARPLPWHAGRGAHRRRRLRRRRALRRLPAPGAQARGRAAGRTRLDAAGRHRARVLPAARRTRAAGCRPTMPTA